MHEAVVFETTASTVPPRSLKLDVVREVAGQRLAPLPNEPGALDASRYGRPESAVAVAAAGADLRLSALPAAAPTAERLALAEVEH